MKAFFIWLEFSEQAIDESVAKRMFKTIERFGHDAQELMLNERLAIGCQSLWVTPEEVDEKQPLFAPSGKQCLVFDGRIDNRAHLISELNAAADLSDAALLLSFLSRYGDSRLSEVIGPFAFVWLDLDHNKLIAARDAMGARYLVYQHTEQRLLIANTELALIAHPSIGYRLNKAKIAGHLISHSEDQPSAYVDDLSVLGAGNVLNWNSTGMRRRVYYLPNPNRRIDLVDDQAYAAEFRRLLDQAVERRQRSVAKVGSMMSGGLDSVPITISASQSQSYPKPIAFSWVFENFPEADERHYSEPICRSIGIRQEKVVCDELWPEFNQDTHLNPLFPFSLPYSEFQQQTFRQARDLGVSVLLSGLHGDLLYEASNHQVVDLLKQAKFARALGEMRYLMRAQSLNLYRFLKRYILSPMSGVQKYIERQRQKQAIETNVLMDDCASQLQHKTRPLFDTSLKARRPLQYRIVLDALAGEDMMLGRIMEAKYGIERRHPFRDRELCEFLLAIPTEQLRRNEVIRPIVKRAYQNELTEQLRTRNDKTTFIDVLEAGIKKDELSRQWLEHTPSYWQQTVKDCYLNSQNQQNTQFSVVKWQCGYYNFWTNMCYDPLDQTLG